MIIFIIVISILAITGAVAVWNRLGFIWICPICAGVSGTWLWTLIGVLAGQLPITNYQLPIGILMGGSTVGIAYQLEKRLPPNRSALFWKTFFIPAGFFTAYSTLNQFWISTILGLATILAIYGWFFLLGNKSRDSGSGLRIEALEKKMEDCC